MISVLINTNLLRACIENKIKKYFISTSACVKIGVLAGSLLSTLFGYFLLLITTKK